MFIKYNSYYQLVQVRSTMYFLLHSLKKEEAEKKQKRTQTNTDNKHIEKKKSWTNRDDDEITFFYFDEDEIIIVIIIVFNSNYNKWVCSNYTPKSSCTNNKYDPTNGTKDNTTTPTPTEEGIPTFIW